SASTSSLKLAIAGSYSFLRVISFEIMQLVRFAVLFGVTRTLLVARDHHVDVRIMRPFRRSTRADLDENRVAVRAVHQAMTIRDAGLPCGGVAGAEHGLAVVLAQHHLTFEHINELVFSLMPMALRGRRPRLERANVDAELGQSGEACKPLARAAFDRLVERRRIAGRGVDRNSVDIDLRHSNQPPTPAHFARRTSPQGEGKK